VNKTADHFTGTTVFHYSSIYRFSKWHTEHGNHTLSVSFKTSVNMVLKEVHLKKFHVTQRTRVASGWRDILIIYLQDKVHLLKQHNSHEWPKSTQASQNETITDLPKTGRHSDSQVI